ncbi:hypothetical protein ACSBR1_013252 [Camellia fascicularis]
MEDDKKAMENMFNITQIYFDTSKKRTKLPQLAQEFFNALDNDKNGKVQIHEFLGFMTEQGLTKMNNRHLFNTLDRDGNGSLDFMEVMCLLYIVKSGRPFCGGCGCFIPDIFFSCTKCFHNEEGSFCLCPTCFHENRFQHKHEQNYFLDNFAMLEMQRLQAVAATKVLYIIFLYTFIFVRLSLIKH